MKQSLAVLIFAALLAGHSAFAQAPRRGPAAPPEASARKTLPGWGPFTFTMTRSQALAAVGGKATFGRHGQLVYPVLIDNEKWEAEVRFFGAAGSVRNIGLAPETELSISSQECLAAWEVLIKSVAQKYGAPSERKVVQTAGQTSSLHMAFFHFADGARIEANVYPTATGKCGRVVAYTPPEPRAPSSF